MRALRIAVVCLLILVPGVASGQSGTPRDRVVEVTFEGPRVFADAQLRVNVRTRPNRRLLGIPGVTWWLWLHRLGESVPGSLGRGLRTTGEPPAHLDPAVLAADVERLRLFFLQEGFRGARVDARVDTLSTKGRLAVRFVLDPGRPTYIRSVRYDGLAVLPEGDRRAFLGGTLLTDVPSDPGPTGVGAPGSVRVSDPASLSFRPSGRRYSEPLLLEEGRRILSFLRHAGFAAVTRDSILAVVVPARPDSFDIVFNVRPGPTFRFGDVETVVRGPEPGVPARVDSFRIETRNDGAAGGLLTVRFEGERRVGAGLFRRALAFRPGDRFDQDLLSTTKRRLDNTGVFAFTDFVSLLGDSARVEGALRVPHRFELQTRPRHRIRFQSFMLQRSGALADSDNEIGTGLGVTYSNLNVFGEGEAFRLSSTGTVAADLTGSGGFTSAQWDVSGTLAFPYLVFPFTGLERRLDLYDARTEASVTLLAARRDALKLVLRGRGSARYRLEMGHSPTLVSLVDLVDVSVSNPDTLAGFSGTFLDDILRSVDDPVQRGQIVEDYTEPQVNNALRYTMRSARLDPFKRDEGHAREASLEIGGNLPYAADRWVFTPGTIEGSLPGLPFFGAGDDGSRLIYRQYVRFVADVRQFRRLDAGSVLAWKAFVGVAHPTGDADVVPFDRRFYSGGAASVRAWGLRELGPGSASFLADSVTTGTTNLLGGEVKLEASVEFRRTVIRNLMAANWELALFADAGNVWSGPRNPGLADGRFRADRFWKELGAGTGVGLRLAWDYLILRLDFAYKVHDPLRQGVILPDGFKDPVVHFGIGHTF